MMVDLDISIVNWMAVIWLFRWWRKVDNSASSPPQIIRMSSMNLSHLIGGVPFQVFRAFFSKDAIKMLARCGAHFVPIATPFF